MAALRQVLAHFATTVDLKPLSEMDKKINVLKANIKKFASYGAAGFVAMSYGAYKLVDAASDAAEQLNVLQTVFKDNQAAVIDWSRTVGKEMGRSEYTFQDSVGKFGAFLTPIFKGGTQDVEQMSKKLSELAVDLASFYNTTDQEAIMRLFSGMSGETEAVRRYGIDISDAALDNFNKSQGDNRTMRALSMKEKAALRYRKILIDTELAQGDAVKTADSWANQLKRAKEELKTLAVFFGKKLLPVATKALKALNGVITSIGETYDFITKKMAIIETALLMIQSYVGALAIQSVIANWTHLSNIMYFTGQLIRQNAAAATAFMGRMAAVAIAFLAIEDVISFLKGNHSVLGDALKAWTGLTEPLDAIAAAAERVAAAFSKMDSYAGLAKIAAGIATMNAATIVGGYEQLSHSGEDAGLDAQDSAKAGSDGDRFFAAVESGDKRAAMAARMPGESREEAGKRFESQRKNYVVRATTPKFGNSVGYGALRAEDLNAGFIPKGANVDTTYGPVTDKNFLKQMSNPGFTKGASGKKYVIQKLEVHTSADGQELLDEAMRKADAAVGEEL